MKKSSIKLNNKNVEALTKHQKGITLIALVITIIVLIILAGVAINLTLGENGIFTRVETAKLKYEIGKAEEELDIKIAELQVEKQGSATLQDVVDMLKEEDMDYIVSLEEIASITGVESIGDVNEIYIVYKIYQFRVDNQLQTEFISIVESYTADVAISSTLKSHDGKNEDEKYLATFEIKVESEGQVQSIEIETVDGTITEVPTSLPYTKEIQVEIGQKYIVKVITPDGKYKRYVVEEKAEETIKTAAELAAFRDKVNSGLTYEGKTVTLVNDINLSRVCYKEDGTVANDVSWETIGYYNSQSDKKFFSGTFDGNNKTISNIYINTDKDYQGLFGRVEYAVIKNLTLDNSTIQANMIVGGVVGYAGNAILQNIHTTENVNIVATSGYTGGIVGATEVGNTTINQCSNRGTINSTGSYVGGIVGVADGIINDCYNSGSIEINENSAAGGIVGINNEELEITNCYNKGFVSGKQFAGGILGRSHASSGRYVSISNCYNSGDIDANSYEGEIAGQIVSSRGETSNCYTKSQVLTNSTLGDAFIADGKIKNENGEWVDNVDSQGNIIYINGGYPILKWQIGE